VRPETAGLILGLVLSGVAAVASVVDIVISIRHNRQAAREREEDRQLAEEQLALARQQAQMRPDLVVAAEHEDATLVLTDEPPHHRRPSSAAMLYAQPPQYRGPGPHGEIRLKLHNAGLTTANHVRGWFYFDAAHLRPVDPEDLEPRSLNSVTAPRPRTFSTTYADKPSSGRYIVSIYEENKSPGRGASTVCRSCSSLRAPL
jgi:hypothetical protein